MVQAQLILKQRLHFSSAQVLTRSSCDHPHTRIRSLPRKTNAVTVCDLF